MEFAARFNADLAFFSCRGVHPESGITDSTEEEADIKRIYMRQARRAFLLCDDSKLGQEFFCKIGDLDAVDGIICNRPLGAEYIHK